MTAFLSTASSVGQFIYVLLIFVFVLAITAWTTKWIANYQKDKMPGENITVLEAKKIAPNKLVEIVKIGDKCYALALGKDEVTLIGEVDEAGLVKSVQSEGTFSFKDFLQKAKDNGVDNNK